MRPSKISADWRGSDGGGAAAGDLPSCMALN
jgi:hypothetical protein